MNKRAIKIIDGIIAIAIKERDTKGYRENLGYDQYNNLMDKLERLKKDGKLKYSEMVEAVGYFNSECKKL